ncbi:hypothetical protein YPPY89_2739, partial [Yersinia pestis PY-89]
MLPNAP